jgi:hypothetical protein
LGQFIATRPIAGCAALIRVTGKVSRLIGTPPLTHCYDTGNPRLLFPW